MDPGEGTSTQQEGRFSCPICCRTFLREVSFTKHFAICSATEQRGGNIGRLQCDQCHSYFSRIDVLERHKNRMHPSDGSSPLLFPCGICDRAFPTKVMLVDHRKQAHVKPNGFHVIQTAHEKQAQFYRIYFPSTVVTLEEGFLYVFDEISNLLETTMVFKRHFKANIILVVEMYKTDEEGEVTRVEQFPFRGEGFSVLPLSAYKENIALSLGDIQRGVEEFLYQVRTYVKFTI